MSDLSSFLSTRNPDWSAAVWDGFIEAVAARLAPLEEQLDIQKEVTDAIIARGLTVIEQELAPIVQQADQILDESTESITLKLARFEQKVTGGTVICVSNTSATLANAATLNLNVVAADREFFAPTPYLALSRATTVANWAIAKVNSFNRSTGALSITLEQVNGAGGPYTDWVITSLPGATLLQKEYYEQTLALRVQVAADKESTGNDRAAALAHRNAANDAAAVSVAARDGSTQAYADMRQAIAAPLIPPSTPVVGQMWWDGSITRVYDGVGFVPTVTTSIGGRRFERGTFGASPDGVITVGGGFTAALVFLNGSLIREGDDYTAESPEVVILAPQEGDEYFVEAYLSTDATDYDTKEEVNEKIATAVSSLEEETGTAITALADVTSDALAKRLRFDVVQTLTPTEAARGRGNVGAQQVGDILEALRVATLAANKLLYATGPSTFGVTDITPYARTLLDDADVKASRATIGASRPAFRAFYPANVGIGNGDYDVTIPSTSLNVGNVWSGSQFTCNEAGLYYFDVNFVTAGGTDNQGTITASIYVGASEIGSSATTKNLYFQPVRASTVQRLNVGDVVKFRLGLSGLAGSIEMLGFRSGATGFLIG